MTSTIFTGNDGNDTLVGAVAAATCSTAVPATTNSTGRRHAERNAVAGGTGDDLYIVDNSGDQAIENPGEADDQVRASVAYTLGDRYRTADADRRRQACPAPGMATTTGSTATLATTYCPAATATTGSMAAPAAMLYARRRRPRRADRRRRLRHIFQFEERLGCGFSDKISRISQPARTRSRSRRVWQALAFFFPARSIPTLFAVGHPTAPQAQFVFDDVPHALRSGTVTRIGGAQAVTIALLAGGTTLHSTDILLV